MPSSNFIIPQNRDELLTRKAGQYYVEEVYSTRNIPLKLQEAKPALIKSSGLEIPEHFDTFYSIVSKFSNLDTTLKQLSWTNLTKVCELFTNQLSKLLNIDPDAEEVDNSLRSKYLTALKMNVYLLTQMIDLYQSQSRQKDMAHSMTTPSKNKKALKLKSSHEAMGMDWESECQRSIQILMNIFDLDIHRLWNTQLVEDELTCLVANICYKVLEDPVLIKSKLVKPAVFHLLGCIIRKHNQSLGASLKLVQMLQHFEHLALPVAEAVQLWVVTYKCKSLVSEILRELDHIPEKEFMRDGASTKTICSFILELARLLPDAVLINISLLLTRMDEESYLMRNSVLSVIGEIIMQCLSKEGLDNQAKQARDQFLDILYDHANLDVNAFVRSRALHIWLNLVSQEHLPVKRCSELAELCVRLLLDKSNLVRKVSVQLLEALLRWNPFGDQLSLSTLQSSLKEEKEKLVKMETVAEEQEKQDDVKKESIEEDQERSEEKGGDADVSIQLVGDQDADAPVEDVLDDEVVKQKGVIEYLSNAVNFVERFQEAVPVLCQLLRSRSQSDVVEAISFFTATWEFNMNFALQGITGMLDQIWNEDQKIREAVVSAYRKLYFKSDSSITSKAQAALVADNMVKLVAGSSSAKLPAIESLIGEMQKSGDLPSPVTQLCWDRLTTPLSSFTMETGMSEAKQQKVAVQLLGMLANENPNVIKSKISTLVGIGFKQRSLATANDVLDCELAYQTCVALSKLATKKTEAGKYTKRFRYRDDHQLITSITALMVSGFDKKSVMWVQFALEAVGVIFQLAENPVQVSTSLFNQIKLIMQPRLSANDPNGEVSFNELLTRFFSLSGQFALKLLVYIDGDVLSEMKQKRKVQEEKEEAEKKAHKKRRSLSKHDSHLEELEENMGVGGATADDADQEFIKNVLETEILAPNSALGSISEWLVRCCTKEVDGSDVSAVRVQQSASLALAKFMLVSCEFCERHLRLLFTMIEQSPHEGIRANLTIAAGDLSVRFPNTLEPWTAHIYARLSDKSVVVRIYATKVLTNLILNDMIKVKGHVSEMARCIVDENEKIVALAKRFFQELAKKGNSMYNVMPDIISRLSDPDIGIKDEVDFKKIMRFLLEFIEKDKQSESLIEKLCHRFQTTRNRQQWRDIAFCLSILNYTEKGVKKLFDNFSLFADVLRDEQVYFIFNNILTKCKKCNKPEVKSQVDELEGKIIDRHTRDVSEDECAAKAANAIRGHKSPTRAGTTQTVRASVRKSKAHPSRRQVHDSSSDDDVPSQPIRRQSTRSRVNRRQVVTFSSDDDDDDFENDSKENVETAEECDEATQEGNDEVSSPIKRKKISVSQSSRSTLRV